MERITKDDLTQGSIDAYEHMALYRVICIHSISSIAQPLRSPDFFQIDFLSLCTMKNTVCETPVDGVIEFLAHISFALLIRSRIFSTMSGLSYGVVRAMHCIANDPNFENLLQQYKNDFRNKCFSTMFPFHFPPSKF